MSRGLRIFGGRQPAPYEGIALRPYLGLVPAVILERSEESKRDYEGNTFTVFTYDGSPIVQSGMREPSHLQNC